MKLSKRFLNIIRVGKLQHRFIFYFTFICLMIAVLSGFVIAPIKTAILDLCQYHAKKLFLTQSLAQDSYNAFQNSMAYLITGKNEKKIGFLRWSKQFDTKFNKILQVSENYQEHQHDRHKQLFDEITQNQKSLILWSLRLFDYFETTRSVDNHLFHEYETRIDTLSSNFEALIQIEEVELIQSEEKVIEAQKNAKNANYLISFFSILLVMILGYLIATDIAKSLKELNSAAKAFGEGKPDFWPNLDRNDEIAELALSFKKMSEDISTKNRSIEQKNRNLEQVLHEVKTLQGILPICCYCKKIRDDAGYWEKVENYIRQRTDAKFSHGICPKCAKKHYPELTFPND